MNRDEKKKERMAYRDYMYRKALREGREYKPRAGKHPEELAEWIDKWFGECELDRTYDSKQFLEWLHGLGSVGTGCDNKYVVSSNTARRISYAKEKGQVSGFGIDDICTSVGRPDLTAEFLASLPVVDDTRRGRNLRVVSSRGDQAGTQETSRRAA